MDRQPMVARVVMRVRPRHVIALVGGFLMLGWGLFLLVDVLNVAGLRDRLIATGIDRPMTWAHLFREGGAAEWLQWLSLGLGAVVMAAVGSREIRTRPIAAWFWLCMSFALVLMLIEDAGNPRHRIRKDIATLTGLDFMNDIAEFAYFTVLAAVPLYALFRFGHGIWLFRRTRCFILLGFCAYAIAGASSATRHWGEWHCVAGDHLYALLGLELAVHMPGHPHLTPGFWLMDKIVEESIELTGAACFLAAAVMYWREAEPAPDPAEASGTETPLRDPPP